MAVRRPNLEQEKRIRNLARIIHNTSDEELVPVGTVAQDIVRQLQRMPHNEARYLFWLYQSFQQERMAAGNRVRVFRAKGGVPLVMEHFFHQFEALEKSMAAALAEWVKHEPVYQQWLSKIRGIGTTLAAGLIAYVRPEYCKTAGSIWRYAGIDVGPHDELATKKYSRTFQKLCWNVGRSFIYTKPRKEGQESFYYEMYLRRKKYEQIRNERGDYADQAAAQLKRYNWGKNTIAYRCYSVGKLPPAHIHARAIRWTVKLFLSHLAHVTYELHYGSPPPAPYVIAIQGHKDFIAPPFFTTKADYALAAKQYGSYTVLPDELSDDDIEDMTEDEEEIYDDDIND